MLANAAALCQSADTGKVLVFGGKGWRVCVCFQAKAKGNTDVGALPEQRFHKPVDLFCQHLKTVYADKSAL